MNITSNSYAEYNGDANITKPKFKVGDYDRISKYKSIFAIEYTQNWSEEVFVVSKIKDTVPVVLSRLSDVVKNDVVKRTVYEKIAAKVNNIDTNAFF